MTWTDGQIEHLKDLWEQKFTATQIAKRLGVTRNSVIGKVYRLGLERRRPDRRIRQATPAQRRWKGGSASKPENTPNARSLPPERATEPDRPTPNSSPQGDPALSSNGGLSLMDLTNTTCRWPVSQTPEGEHLFCGAPADLIGKRPYCAAHERIARVRPRRWEQAA